MNINQIVKLKEEDTFFHNIINKVEEIEGTIFINEKTAIPITEISPFYNDEEDILINDEDGNNLGILCFCKKIVPIKINELTEWQFIALLIDSDYHSIHYHRFNYDYLVLEKDTFYIYINNYLQTSPVWGKFYHMPDIPLPHKIKPNEIIAVRNILLPTKYDVENSLRAIKEPYSFERYLKQYHLLELIFDLELVNKIKALDDNLMGIGKVLADYKREDFQRLYNIINSKCNDYEAIAQLLNKVENHIDKAQSIFFDFSKENNPLESITDLKSILNENKGFEKLENIKKYKNIKDYSIFISKLSAYWIYRIRCSIAHNKIGEYVMAYDDEAFVVEFGEPLLNQILIQILKS